MKRKFALAGLLKRINYKFLFPLCIVFNTDAHIPKNVFCDSVGNHIHLDILRENFIHEQYLYLREENRVIHSYADTVLYDGILDDSPSVQQRFNRFRDICDEQSVSVTYNSARLIKKEK